MSHTSKITLARLFNLGNYEHVRYEITVDVAPTDAASLVLAHLENILEALAPNRTTPTLEQIDHAKRRLEELGKMSPEEYKALQAQSYDTHIKQQTQAATVLAAAEELRALRLKRSTHLQLYHAARRALDALGGTSKHTDAKVSWGDDDDQHDDQLAP